MNILGITEMESLSSKNKNLKYILCVIDVFAKNGCLNPLKVKKGKTAALNAFTQILSSLF